MLDVTPVNPRSRARRPFFPGYLFVRADLKQIGLSTIQWAPGVSKILSYGQTPVPIPERIVEGIRDRVVQYGGSGPAQRFCHGQPVRIVAGPFEGYEGMFDTQLNGAMRARVLVAFVHRLTAVELDARQLEEIRSFIRAPR
jgi:transcriptional antiterminator RfaH